MRTVDVLVVGAGPTGIGAGHRLGQLDVDWLMVEAGAGPGGMACSVTDDQGFVWDLGGHVLHSHFDEFDKAIADAGVIMLSPVRNGWVWLGGQLLPTPIQHHVTALPLDLDPNGPVEHLGDYYRNNFGEALYQRFFKPFTEKMWATPLELIDDQWTSLRNGSTERNVPTIRVGTSEDHRETVTFPYPAGGTGKLWEALASRLDQQRILYDVKVESIDLLRRVAHLSNGESVLYQHCVSTMPLTELLVRVGVPSLAERASQFLSSQTFVVGLGFTGAPPDTLADKSWLYSPDPDVAWHRATMLSNYDQDNAGPGRWSVLCEVGRSAFRVIDDAEAVANCEASMTRLGADPATRVSTWTRTVPMGYPVPTRGRDELLVGIDEQLTEHGIRSRGRFGGWRYESCNQDYSFLQGIQAVDASLDGSDENVFWRPEHG